MMRLVILPRANRDLRRLPRNMADRVAAAVRSLTENPRPPGCLLVKGEQPPTWRIRVGDWRVFYEIDDEAGVVTTVGVRRRDQAY